MKTNLKMKIFWLGVAIFICGFSIGALVRAEEAVPPAPTVNLVIRDGETVLFSGPVALPAASTINLNDSAGAPHPINSQSVLSILNSADLESDNFGISLLEYYSSFDSLYVKCIAVNPVGERCDNWQYLVGGSYPAVGMDKNILSGGENIQVFFEPQPLIAIEPPGTQSASPGGTLSGGAVLPPAFSVPNALAYLKSVQSADGSFAASEMHTDWAAIAYGAAGFSDNSRDALLSFMRAEPPGPLPTDASRRAMALLALGQNPYSFDGRDHIAPVVNSFDGAQFGDASLTNDDIFALIPLTAAGYTVGDDIIKKDIEFILSRQQVDGSWEESVDLSAAAVQALKPFDSMMEVSAALQQASIYLQNAQSDDGGFGSIYSTSWAAQAMNALGAPWTKNGRGVLDYFAGKQEADGAALPLSETLSNRIWATSYAIPAALGKPWNAILHSFPKPPTSPIAGNLSNTEEIPSAASKPELPKPKPPSARAKAPPPPTEPLPIPPASPKISSLEATAARGDTSTPRVVIAGAAGLLLGLAALKLLRIANK